MMDKKDAMRIYTPPFSFNRMGGYIFDKEGLMFADTGDHEEWKNSIARIRGWGLLQNIDDIDPYKTQDMLGEIFAEALTEYWEKHLKL